MFSIDVRLSMLSCGMVLDWYRAGRMVGRCGGGGVVLWYGDKVVWVW